MCPNRKVNDKGRKMELGFEKGQLQVTIGERDLSVKYVTVPWVLVTHNCLSSFQCRQHNNHHLKIHMGRPQLKSIEYWVSCSIFIFKGLFGKFEHEPALRATVSPQGTSNVQNL